MTLSTEVTLALLGLIVTLAGTAAILALSIRGLAKDARDSNKLTMNNATEFTKLIAETRREADTHQAQRAEWEREGRDLRDKMDVVLDRVRELEQGCEESEAQIQRQADEIAQLRARVAELTAAVSERDERITKLNERIEKLEAENGRLTREEGKWQADRLAWERERKALQAENDGLKMEQTTLAAQVAELQLKVAKLEKGTGQLPALDEVMDAPPGGADDSHDETPKEAEENQS